jgi:hypothetical protein
LSGLLSATPVSTITWNVPLYDLRVIIASFIQVSDGRRNADVRNRKKDGDEGDNQQFTVSSSFSFLLVFYSSLFASDLVLLINLFRN